MKRVLFILMLLPFISRAQVYQYMPQYGYQMQRGQIDSVLKIPADTVRNKTGIVRIGITLYAGNGTYWTSAGGSAAWLLTGNASTTAGTNFIGTTDNVRFDIRTNNSIRASVLGTGNVGIGTTTPTAKLHVYTDANNYSKLGGRSQRIISLDTAEIKSSYVNILSSGSLDLIAASNDINIPLGFNAGTANTITGDLIIGSNLYFNQAGYLNRVGLGTSTPSQKLHVIGGAKADSVITPELRSPLGTGLNINGGNNLRLNANNGAVEVYSSNTSDIVLNSDDDVHLLPVNQVTINTPASPQPTAILDITAKTKGLLIPRMTTTQRNAISSPATGLLIWNTTDSTLNQYRGLSGWSAISGGGGGASVDSLLWSQNGTNIFNKSGRNVGINNASPSYPLDVTGRARFTDSTFAPSMYFSNGSYPQFVKAYDAITTMLSGARNWLLASHPGGSNTLQTQGGGLFYQDPSGRISVNTYILDSLVNINGSLKVIGNSLLSNTGIRSASSATVSLIVKGVGSGTDNVAEFRNSSNTLLARVREDGFLLATTVIDEQQKASLNSSGVAVGGASILGFSNNIYAWETLDAGVSRTAAATLAVGNGTAGNTTGTILAARALSKQGADVASTAGAMTLGTDGTTFEITGTNSITLLSNVGWVNGNEVTLLFTGAATLVNGTATSGTNIIMKLAGAVDFVATADDTITLVLSEIGGTQAWREKCRSVN